MTAVAAVRAAATVAGTRRDASRRALGGDSSLTLLHVGASVTLISRDRTRALRAGSRVSEGAGTLQLAEDGIFVGEKIAHEAVTKALVHSQGILEPWTEDAWRERVCQCGDICLIG